MVAKVDEVAFAPSTCISWAPRVGGFGVAMPGRFGHMYNGFGDDRCFALCKPNGPTYLLHLLPVEGK